ncbi:MAG: hypothetical protein ACXV3F_09200 [Frankiaceae bacterium]
MGTHIRGDLPSAGERANLDGAAVESQIARTGRFVSGDRAVIVEAGARPACVPRAPPSMRGFGAWCTNFWDHASLKPLPDMAAVHECLWVNALCRRLAFGEREQDVARGE